MNNKQIVNLFRKSNACSEAVEWAMQHGGTPAELWRDCEHGEWMTWIVAKWQDQFKFSRQQIVLALCDCAALSLKIWEDKYPKDKRPRNAIKMARAWARGKATNEELKAAAYIASVAASAAYVAYAAYADSVAYAAYADSVASAAYADSVASAARKKTLLKCANIYRKHFPNIGK